METAMGVVTNIFSIIGEVASTIQSNALLLIPVAIALAGAGIGMAKGLMGTKKRRGK